MRRSARAILAAGAAVLAGCGVPGETGVVADAEGMPKSGRISSFGQAVPKGPAEAGTPRELVDYFLRAAAGDIEGAPGRLRKFLQRSTADAWQPRAAITIVRIAPEAIVPTDFQGGTKVDVTMRAVGRMTNTGAVEPIERTDLKIALDVVRDETTGQRTIVQPPNEMYLNAEALESLYVAQPIYFWDRSGRTLVPDVRYLPRSVPEAQRADVVARWLLAGPSPWLAPVVRTLPSGIELRGRILGDGDRRVVDLSANPTTVGDIGKLVTQLRWSLRGSDSSGDGLTLKIAGVETKVDTSEGYLSANEAARAAGRPWFCIAGGVILPNCTEPADLGRVPALTPQTNARVTKAAIADNGRRAALVRAERGNTLYLNSADRSPPESWATALSGTRMSRPVWLTVDDPPATAGLVLVDGTLRQFSTATRAVPVVPTPGVVGATAFAVAPDNRRIALVAGGRLYLATLGVERGAVAVGQARSLPSELPDISAVAWSQQDWLVVAGRVNGQSQLTELSIDGAIEKGMRAEGLGTNVVTQLVASTDNPVPAASPGELRLEASDGRAYEVRGRIEPIVVKPQATQSPTPPASVTAVFYAD